MDVDIAPPTVAQGRQLGKHPNRFGLRTMQSAYKFRANPFTQKKPPSPSSSPSLETESSWTTHNDVDYLHGLRGFFVVQSFLWTFLQTFLPSAVKTSNPSVAAALEQTGYQSILRKSLSVLFWNDSMIYSLFFLLSARSICVPFLQSPTKTTAASSIFKRGLRLWWPVVVSLAMSKIISSVSSARLESFKQATANSVIAIPYDMPNTLAYFNSVFNMFWTTRDFQKQAGSTAFPGQTLWVLNVIYTQSYTVYMTMLIIPYTRSSWRIKVYTLFILTAWWVQSWAWYSITGLLIADVVTNMDFKLVAKRGIDLSWMTLGKKPLRCPAWVPCVVLIAAGLVMQFLWVAWRPNLASKEMMMHAGLYYSGGLNTEFDPTAPQARADNYLVLLGLMLLLEMSDLWQKAFRSPLLVYLGKRALSWFLVQSIIVYTAGIAFYMYLTTTKAYRKESANGLCLLVCAPLVTLAAEIFYRLVDYPSQALARLLFKWIRM